MPSATRYVQALRNSAQTIPQSLLIVSTAVALSLLGDQMIYVVLPVVYKSAGIPVTAVGLLLSANRFVRLLTNSLSGYVIDRFGRQWPFVLSLILGGLTTIAYGVTHGVWAFLVARLLWGTSWSFIRIEGLSTALDVATEHTRGRYMGLFQAMSRVGGAVAMLAGGLLTDTIGFRLTFILFGIVTCGSALLAHMEMSRRDASGKAQAAPLASAATSAPDVTAAPSPASTVRAPSPMSQLSWWHVIVPSLGTFSTLLVIGGAVSATLGYMLQARFGPTPRIGLTVIGVASLTGLLLGTRGVLELCLAPVTGYLADRWGRHRMIMMTMPLSVVLVASLGWNPSLLMIIAIIPAISVTGVTLNVAFNAVAGDIAPIAKRSMFLSLFVTFQDLGSAIGPLLGYWIAPRFGLFWLYTSGAAMLLVVSVIYIATFARAARPQSL